jgi:hypothetical protein
MTEIAMGSCPICTGTGHMPCPDSLRKYGVASGWYGYRAEDDTVRCTNCGGQYQGGGPTGKVRQRPDMFPCVHEYVGANIGRCYNKYTCKHCGDSYTIDSSD